MISDRTDKIAPSLRKRIEQLQVGAETDPAGRTVPVLVRFAPSHSAGDDLAVLNDRFLSGRGHALPLAHAVAANVDLEELEELLERDEVERIWADDTLYTSI